MRDTSLTPLFGEYIPSDLEPGTLYISMEFETAVHLCACGCGSKVVTPFGPRDWVLTYDGTVTLRPSVGNGQQPCRSHYLIRHDRIDWLPQISTAATRATAVRDRALHAEAVSPSAMVPWWRRVCKGIRRLRNSD